MRLIVVAFAVVFGFSAISCEGAEGPLPEQDGCTYAYADLCGAYRVAEVEEVAPLWKQNGVVSGKSASFDPRWVFINTDVTVENHPDEPGALKANGFESWVPVLTGGVFTETSSGNRHYLSASGEYCSPDDVEEKFLYMPENPGSGGEDCITEESGEKLCLEAVKVRVCYRFTFVNDAAVVQETHAAISGVLPTAWQPCSQVTSEPCHTVVMEAWLEHEFLGHPANAALFPAGAITPNAAEHGGRIEVMRCRLALEPVASPSTAATPMDGTTTSTTGGVAASPASSL